MEDKDLPYDIIFLRNRLEYLVEKEEYERAVVIKKWIDELTIFYNINDEQYKKIYK